MGNMRRCLPAFIACALLGGCHLLLSLGSSGADAGRAREGTADSPPASDRPGVDGQHAGAERPAPLDRRSGERRDATTVTCKDQQAQTLPEILSPALTAAVMLFNGGCKVPSTYCQLLTARAYQVPVCFAGPTTVAGVLPLVLEQGDMDPSWWTPLAPSAVEQTYFFGTTYSTTGAGVLGAVNAYGGSATPAGTYIDAPLSCQNCTRWQTTLVLLYPSGSIVRLDGTFGYDS
jgi:hypothetical protein